MTSLLGRLTLESEEEQPDSSVDANEASNDLPADAQKMRALHSHDSDSGLGSSVSSVGDSGSDEERGKTCHFIENFRTHLLIPEM